MTDQERSALVNHIENQIRKFEIVAVGVIVEGGFGPLPKSDDLPTRVANIEHAIQGFRLHSSDLDVGGTFDDGYTLS